MSGGKEENVYENVSRVSDHQQLWEGKPPEPSQKRAVIIQTVLILLSLGLIASLVTTTVKYHQELKEKHQVAEAIQRMKDFLKHNNVSNASALEQNGLPLLVKLQLLMDALEEVNASWAATRNEYNLQELKEKHQVAEAIQRMKDFLKHNKVSSASALEQNGLPLLVKLQLLMNALEEFNASCAATRNQYSGFRTMISRGWRYNGENFYYISEEKKSWEEAKQFCKSQNSHLTSILTQQEQDYLSRATIGSFHWIGLSDLGREGDWRWEDGTSYTERGFWGENQPDNWKQGIGGSEDCVFLRGYNNGEWNDASCTLKERWICKFAGQI